MPAHPCQFCQKLTTIQNVDGPICGVCLLAFQRGRFIGIRACIDTAKKHGASAKVIDELSTLV